MSPKAYISAALVFGRSRPQVPEPGYQTELAAGDDVLASSQCLSLGQPQLVRLLAIVTAIEEVRTGQNGLGAIFGDMTVIGDRILLGVSIGRDFLDGIFQVTEYQVIHRIGLCLRNILARGMFQQGNVLPQTDHVEIAQGTKGVRLSQVCILGSVVIPLDTLCLVYELIATENGCIIRLPQRLVHIRVRRGLAHVKAVNDLRVAAVIVAGAAEALVAHDLRQLINGKRRAIGNCTLPSVIASIERTKPVLLALIVVAGIRFGLGSHVHPALAA